jgi:hypothetical protein
MDNDTYIVGEPVFNTNSKHFGKVVKVKVDIHPDLIRVEHDRDVSSFVNRDYYWSKELTIKVTPDTPQNRLMIQLKYA